LLASYGTRTHDLFITSEMHSQPCSEGNNFCDLKCSQKNIFKINLQLTHPRLELGTFGLEGQRSVWGFKKPYPIEPVGH